MNIVIIEDITLAAQQLEKMLLELRPNYKVMDKLTSIDQSVQWLQLNQPDLILLDIHLEDGLSFSIFEHTPTDIPIIFTTAYDQYAIEAFRVNSIDYLLKPIQKDDLLRAIEKYERIRQPLPDYTKLFESFRPVQPSYTERFTVRYGNKIKAIESADIAWFEGRGNEIHIMLKSGKSYITDQSLETFEKQLDPKSFFRINRQYIVAFKSIIDISVYSKSKVKLTLLPAPTGDVFVSLSKYAGFKAWLNQ